MKVEERSHIVKGMATHLQPDQAHKCIGWSSVELSSWRSHLRRYVRPERPTLEFASIGAKLHILEQLWFFEPTTKQV